MSQAVLDEPSVSSPSPHHTSSCFQHQDKGRASLLASPDPILSLPGGTLVWHDNTAVNYSNWGQHDTGPSMLSQNSCYWIQSSNGVWRLGSCTNVTMGVICKIPRGRDLMFERVGSGQGAAGQSCVLLAGLAMFGAIVLLWHLRGGGQGAMVVCSSLCVAIAVEESSFSRAGEWHCQPRHSTRSWNQSCQAELQHGLCE